MLGSDGGTKPYAIVDLANLTARTAEVNALRQAVRELNTQRKDIRKRLSEPDHIDLTRMIAETCKVMEISVQDHNMASFGRQQKTFSTSTAGVMGD